MNWLLIAGAATALFFLWRKNGQVKAESGPASYKPAPGITGPSTATVGEQETEEALDEAVHISPDGGSGSEPEPDPTEPVKTIVPATGPLPEGIIMRGPYEPGQVLSTPNLSGPPMEILTVGTGNFVRWLGVALPDEIWIPAGTIARPVPPNGWTYTMNSTGWWDAVN
jgi:hypothetical protein